MILALMIWNLTSPCAIVIVGIVFIGDIDEEKEDKLYDSSTNEHQVKEEEFNIYIKIKNIILNDANKNKDSRDYREKNYNHSNDYREKSIYIVSKPIPIPYK
jgi:hypothetical protein